MYSRYNTCSAFIISVCFTLKLWLFSRPTIVVNLQFMVNVKLFCSFLQNLLFEFFVMLNWWRLVYKTNTNFGGHVFPFLFILFCFNGVHKKLTPCGNRILFLNFIVIQLLKIFSSVYESKKLIFMLMNVCYTGQNPNHLLPPVLM